MKKRNAEARRERFTTGGGPPPSKDKTDELADLLTGIMEDQQPLDGIPDDDHLDSGHEELSTNGKYTIESELVTSFCTYRLFHCLCLSLFSIHSKDHVMFCDVFSQRKSFKHWWKSQCTVTVHPPHLVWHPGEKMLPPPSSRDQKGCPCMKS